VTHQSFHPQLPAKTACFAPSNKKVAYELTHIVFYLSKYGRRDPKLDCGAVQSHDFIGIIAYLDQNTDHFAEICIALGFGGQTPGPIWEEWIVTTLSDFQDIEQPSSNTSDAYHEYLVIVWMALAAKRDDIVLAVLGGRLEFVRGVVAAWPLRNFSNLLLKMDADHSSHWEVMRPILE
jgi:hypothetical protein